MINYQQFRNFVKILEAFHKVERVARVPGLSRRTNASEHTFDLAMLAWYTASSNKLPLDIDKVVMYALAHDLIEVYAGDTYVFDEKGRETKAHREEEARARIEQEFPEFSELQECIHRYEARSDEESKFVYALDKMIDPLNCLDLGEAGEETIWKEMGITLSQHRQAKDMKVRTSQHIVPLWEQFLIDVEKDKDRLFAKEE